MKYTTANKFKVDDYVRCKIPRYSAYNKIAKILSVSNSFYTVKFLNYSFEIPSQRWYDEEFEILTPLEREML